MMYNLPQYTTIFDEDPIVAKFEFKMSFSKILHTILMVKGRQPPSKKMHFYNFCLKFVSYDSQPEFTKKTNMVK